MAAMIRAIQHQVIRLGRPRRRTTGSTPLGALRAPLFSCEHQWREFSALICGMGILKTYTLIYSNILYYTLSSPPPLKHQSFSMFHPEPILVAQHGILRSRPWRRPPRPPSARWIQKPLLFSIFLYSCLLLSTLLHSIALQSPRINLSH